MFYRVTRRPLLLTKRSPSRKVPVNLKMIRLLRRRMKKPLSSSSSFCFFSFVLNVKTFFERTVFVPF